MVEPWSAGRWSSPGFDAVIGSSQNQGDREAKLWCHSTAITVPSAVEL